MSPGGQWRAWRNCTFAPTTRDIADTRQRGKANRYRGLTLGGFGSAAGVFALFFFSDIPRVRHDIMMVCWNSVEVGDICWRKDRKSRLLVIILLRIFLLRITYVFGFLLYALDDSCAEEDWEDWEWRVLLKCYGRFAEVSEGLSGCGGDAILELGSWVKLGQFDVGFTSSDERFTFVVLTYWALLTFFQPF